MVVSFQKVVPHPRKLSLTQTGHPFRNLSTWLFLTPPEWACSVMSNSVTPWTVAYQATQSMGFPRQEYWSGLPFHTPGDLPNLGVEPMSSAWLVNSLPLSRWEAQLTSKQLTLTRDTGPTSKKTYPTLKRFTWNQERFSLPREFTLNPQPLQFWEIGAGGGRQRLVWRPRNQPGWRGRVPEVQGSSTYGKLGGSKADLMTPA